nr:hypothetical protein [Kofleriaceae bacterium]
MTITLRRHLGDGRQVVSTFQLPPQNRSQEEVALSLLIARDALLSNSLLEAVKILDRIQGSQLVEILNLIEMLRQPDIEVVV